MPYFLSKLLPLFVMPLSLGIFVAILALLLIVKGKRSAAVFALVFAIMVLWVSSLPMVAGRLLWSLQRQYLPVAITDIPSADCIVVLGGVVGRVSPPRATIDLYDAVDRVYQTAQLYRLGKARNVIVAAGNQPWAKGLEPEANIIRDLLVEWGVPRRFIALDISSKNTRENALNSAALIHEAGCQSTLLVTSAWHMPRAVASFEAVGVAVFPVSVDLKLSGGEGGSLARFIPQAGAMAATSQAIHEWMGIWVYRWRGWN